MKKILFLTPQLPYAPISGGLIKTYKMIEFLSNNYTLDVISLLKQDDESHINEFKNKLNKVNNLLTFKPDDERRNVKNLIFSYIKKQPLNIIRNFSTDLKKFMENFDLSLYDNVIIDHYVMFQYIFYNKFLNNKKNTRILLHQHNAEYLIWNRFLKHINIYDIRKGLAFIEYKRIKNYEKKICNLADKVLCVSNNDIKNLSKLGINKNKFELVLSVGDDYLLQLPNIKFENTEKIVLFIGTLSWEANIQGLIWFINNVWYKVLKYIPDMKLIIIGKNPPKQLIKYQDNNIIFQGFVENLEEFYVRSRIFISPLFFGSGIKIKNINAMYRGIPLITTSIGAEGIEGENGKHFFICNDSDSMIDKIILLMNSKEEWEKLSINSRKLMKEKYTWEKSFNNLRRVIENNQF